MPWTCRILTGWEGWQRLVSTIYEPLNQYYVVLTLDPAHGSDPAALDQIYVTSSANVPVPLAAIAHWDVTNAPLAINHQGRFVAATISFNLASAVSLDRATAAVEAALAALNPPASVRGVFAGSAQVFRDSIASQPKNPMPKKN